MGRVLVQYKNKICGWNLTLFPFLFSRRLISQIVIVRMFRELVPFKVRHLFSKTPYPFVYL